MKFFWALVAILILGAVGVITMRGGSPNSPAAAIKAPAIPAPQALPVAPPNVPPALQPITPPEPLSSQPKPVTPEPAPAAPANVPATAPAEVVAAPATEQPMAEAGATAKPAEAEASAEFKEAEASKLLDELKAIQMPGEAAVEKLAASTGEVVIPAEGKWSGDKIIPARAARAADGALNLDDRFALKGSGTKEDPYLVTWDLVVSAQETYRPRLGQTKLPQRVTLLDGKYVKISGYVAFPITSSNPKELLVMLNQWDGCCIGVPPTAYDAVEVKLAQPANAQQRFTQHGSLTGKFKVDPYEDGGWLLGLYVMDDAVLSADQ